MPNLVKNSEVKLVFYGGPKSPPLRVTGTQITPRKIGLRDCTWKRYCITGILGDDTKREVVLDLGLL